jgi:hypothetical protein
VAWNLPEIADDWTAEFWWPVTSAPDETHRPGRLILASDAPFHTPQYRILRWTWRRTVDDLVALLGTYSRIMALDSLTRKVFLDRQRSVVPAETVDVKFTTVCWRAVHIGG